MSSFIAAFQRCMSRAWAVLIIAIALAIAPISVLAAPYADMVIDARTGQVLHATNADARLHPASLTKMMTLYITFEAIEHGEISLDTMVTVSKYAASQPPSRLGLRAGQKIALRYLIRAAAIKSANDAAAAIGDAIEGDRASFAKRMNRTAKKLGMTRTTFANANGLTASGHLSTARDMTTLGRRLFYDFPQYYSIFSRRTADAGMAQVASTNRRFLDSYEGADGIKTGYTAPAGFNLVASAQRGNKRIIATVFGGKSTAQRNARVAELLDLGFGKAPNRVKEAKPPEVEYIAKVEEEEAEDLLAEAVASDVASDAPAAGKTLRVQVAVAQSPRPRSRSSATQPVALAALDPAPPASAADPETVADEAIAEDAADLASTTDALMASMEDTINAALTEAQAAPPEDEFAQTTIPQPETLALAANDVDPAKAAEATDALAAESEIAPSATPRPVGRPATLAGQSPMVAETELAAAPVPEVTQVDAGQAPDEAIVTAAAPATAVPAVLVVPEATMFAAAEQRLPETPAMTPVEPAASQLAGDVILSPAPKPEEPEIILAAAEPAQRPTPVEQEIVTRVSTSGGREYGINVGSFSSRYNAEKELLRVALVEMSTLDEALRKVSSRKGAFDANFVGMTQETADLACRRLQARGTDCTVLAP